MSARHRVKKSKSHRVAKVVAAPAVAALLITGTVDQPVRHPAPIEFHQPSPHRLVSAEQVALAALALFAVPGAGVQFPAGALEQQDDGIWTQIEDLTVLNDPVRYPGTVTKDSLEAGASWLTELVLARDPSTTVTGIDTGSFGGRVAAEALNRIADAGYDMSTVFGVFYGDSNTPGTGLFARYQDSDATFGSDIPGGSVPLPDGTYLRVNREYDPIAYFPKYLFNPISWLQIVAGFVFEHSRLDHFDFDDPQNVVTVDGNVVTVRVNSPVMPLLQPLKLLGVPTRIVLALQDIMQPLVESTGMYETGKVGFLPTPQKTIQYITNILKGFEKAGQRLAGTLPPDEPNVPPVTDLPTTTQEIIDAMKAKDAELNGTSTATLKLAASKSAAPTGAVTADALAADLAEQPKKTETPEVEPAADPEVDKVDEKKDGEVTETSDKLDKVEKKDAEVSEKADDKKDAEAAGDTTKPAGDTEKVEPSQAPHRTVVTSRKPKRDVPADSTVSDAASSSTPSAKPAAPTAGAKPAKPDADGAKGEKGSEGDSA